MNHTPARPVVDETGDLDLDATEAQLAAAAVAILGPNTAPCDLCGVGQGEPCLPDCIAAMIEQPLDVEPLGCDDCGALVAQRCARTCPRYADL